MSRSVLASFILILLGILQAHAVDCKVSGYVVDSDGNPVPYARVAIVGGSISTLCNSHGAYSLTIPAGAHTLQADMVGYEPKQVTLDVTSRVNCNFTLADKALALGAVTVTAKSDN